MNTHYVSKITLFLLLLLGNTLRAMDADSLPAAAEETESLLWAPVRGVTSLVGTAGQAYRDAEHYLFYERNNNNLYLFANPTPGIFNLFGLYPDRSPETLESLLYRSCVDLNCGVGPSATPLWIVLRTPKVDVMYYGDGVNRTVINEARTRSLEIIKAYEEEQWRANKLSDFDLLLRALFDWDDEKVLGIIKDNPEFGINGQDCNQITALKIVLYAKNYRCIPILCDHPDFDPNTPFMDGESATCVLLKILLMNQITEASLKTPKGKVHLHAICSLAERGATISPEIIEAHDGKCTIIGKNYLLLKALGIQGSFDRRPQRFAFHNEQDIDPIKELVGFERAALERPEENLVCCYLWATEGALYGDHQQANLLPIEAMYQDTLFDARMADYVESEGLSFKEFLKAQLRHDWHRDPQGINMQDLLGMTPMMWAAARGNLELAQFLTEFQGLDLTVIDTSFGFNALHFALRNGHSDMVKLLIGIPGPHRLQKTRSERTPLELAQYGRQQAIVELFRI